MDFDQDFKKHIRKLDLFRIDAEEFGDELNKVKWYEVKQVSYALKKKFKNEEFLLDNATITKREEKEWVITDGMPIKFIVRKEAKKLNLDKMRKFLAKKGNGKLKIYNTF